MGGPIRAISILSYNGTIYERTAFVYTRILIIIDVVLAKFKHNSAKYTFSFKLQLNERFTAR